MKIAIIDDIASERVQLQDRLTTQIERLSLHAEILTFADGETFLSAARQKNFTIVFLDIYLKKENGIDIAKRLRSFDQNCILIFTTTSTDHALDGFRVRAFHYLVKPYADRELEKLFDEMIERLPTPDLYIEVRVVGGTKKLRLQEILYAEHFQHQIHIYTVDGEKTITRQTFREFTEALNDERFFLCSRGVIVNLEYVEDFDGNNFLLKNGKKLPVSRSLTQSARYAFGDFLFKRGRD